LDVIALADASPILFLGQVLNETFTELLALGPVSPSSENRNRSMHLEPFPRKPKGMHWRSYERLAARYNGLMNSWTAGIMQRFGIGR
jgi:hypothetical protein